VGDWWRRGAVHTERECAEEACFLLLVELVGRCEGVVVVGEVVICEVRF
jgi:hypothetical protein